MDVVKIPITLPPLLSQCLELLRLLHLSLAFLDHFSYLVVRCSNVQQRLYVWAQSCGLVGSTYLEDVFTDEDERRTIHNALEQIQSLLCKMEALLQRYGPVAAASGLQITTQVSKLQVAAPDTPPLEPARRLTRRPVLDGLLRKQSRVLLRMKWAVADKEKLSSLIENARCFVEDLEKITLLRNVCLSQRAMIQEELQKIQGRDRREVLQLAYAEHEDAIEETNTPRTRDWSEWNGSCYSSSPRGESVEGSMSTEYKHLAAVREVVPMFPSVASIESPQAPSGPIIEYLSSILQGAQETLKICDELLTAEYTEIRSSFGTTSELVNHTQHSDFLARDKSSMRKLQHFQSLVALNAAGKGLASELLRVSRMLSDLQSGLLLQPDIIPASRYIIFAWVLSLRIITNAWRWSCHQKGCKVQDAKRKCVEFVTTVTNDLEITTEGLQTSFVYRSAKMISSSAIATSLKAYVLQRLDKSARGIDG